jgi:signal transduction histidine kinase
MRAALIATILGGCLFAGISACASQGQTPLPPGRTLTNAAQIRNLTVARAAQAIPVHLQGVMISEAAPLPLPSGAPDHQHCALVLSDPTAAIYLTGTTNLLSGFHEGDRLVVDGVTDPGQFAPFVRAEAARRLGTAPIPPPLPVSYQKLITGGLDAQWVELSGVVRSWEPDAANQGFGSWLMVLAVDGNKVTITATGPHPPQVEPDAEVRVHCVCFYQFNQQRQVLNPALVMPRDAPVAIERPAPANSFATPVRPLASILQFAPDSVSGHRIHVRGTVTFQQSGQMFWLRDASGAAGIQTRHAEALRPGDEIDVLGFPRYGSGSALLEDAVFQKRASGAPPKPLALTSLDESFNHDADLVSLEARLADVQPMPGGEVLALREDDKSFKAVLKAAPNTSLPDNWQPGSRVRVIGICSVISDDSSFVVSGIWHPQSFQILLRSPADLSILMPPPWWTPGHVILVLGLVIGGLLLVTGVVALLARHRLNEQERRRTMAEAEFTAILSERNRLAREIHDTLAQGLVATSVQLRLAKKQAAGAPEPLHHHLDAAQQLVRGSLEEARHSIWNMRSQILETNDLPSALKGILTQMADGGEMKTQFTVSGRPRRFAPVIENNLLRVGQEAITNAVNHARAKQIQVTLDFGEKQFRLAVADDGGGFDLANPPASDGGFGLAGMRERAAELKGILNIRTASGQGTEIMLTVPMPAE